MKKQMAIVMAGAMAMTTIPMSVFAASTATATIRSASVLNGNSVRNNAILVATSGAGLTVEALKDEVNTRQLLQDKGYDVVAAPILLLSDVTAAAGSQIELVLSNGSWFNSDFFDRTAIIDTHIPNYDTNGNKFKIIRNEIYGTRIIIEFTEAVENQSIKIPVLATVKNTDALTVSVRPLDESSNVNGTTLTAATVNAEASGGNTSVTVSKFSGKNSLYLSITNTENNAATFGTGSLTLDATGKNHPAGVYGDGVEKVTYTLNSAFEFVDYSSADGTNVQKLSSEWAQYTGRVVVDNSLNGKFDKSNVWIRQVSTNKVEVIYDFSSVPLTANASSVRIRDLGVQPKRSTALDTKAYITITPNENSSFSEFTALEAGTYTSYGYASSVIESTYPTLPAGSLGFTPYGKGIVGEDKDVFDTDITTSITKNDFYNTYHKTATLKLQENIAGALIAGRDVEFVFPEGIEVVGYKIVNSDEFELSTSYGVEYDYTALAPGVEIDDNVLSFTAGITDKATSPDPGFISLQFWVASDANFSGDVDVVVTGDALAGQSLDPVTVAKVAPAFTIDTTINTVKAGVQTTPTSDITITETKAGSFKDGETVRLRIDTKSTATLNNALNITNADVKVTDGDLNIKDIKVKEGYVTFVVSGESAKASTIELTNVKVSTAFGLPETNDYPFDIALSTDKGETEEDGNEVASKSIKFGELRANYINISSTGSTGGTAADGAVVQVAPGSAIYTVDGVQKEMPVAPFIDANSQSLMVPVRFIADGVGLTSENGKLIWSAQNNTVYLINGNDRIAFTVGNDYYEIAGMRYYGNNGATTQIVNNRCFVPFRLIGEALGIPVSWDAVNGIAQYN